MTTSSPPIKEEPTHKWFDKQKKIVSKVLESTEEYSKNYAATAKLYKTKDVDRYKYVVGNDYIFRHSLSPKLELATFNSFDGQQFTNLKWQTVLNVNNVTKNGSYFIHSLDCIDINNCIIGYKENLSDAVSFIEYTNSYTKFSNAGGSFFDAKYLTKDVIIFNDYVDENSITTMGWPKTSSIWFRDTPTKTRTTLLDNPSTSFSDVINISLDSSWTGVVVDYSNDHPNHTYIHNSNGQMLFKDIYDLMTIQAHFQGTYFAFIKKPFVMDGKQLNNESIVQFEIKNEEFINPKTVFECNDTCSINTSSMKLVKDGMIFLTSMNFRKTLNYINLREGTHQEVILETLDTADNIEIFASINSGLIMLKRSNPIVRGEIDIIELNSGAIASYKKYENHFDTGNLMIELRWTESKDGTLIPYHIVRSKDANENTPAMMRVYGASKISNSPYYSKNNGEIWLAKGYSIVWPHTRGGGEFGEEWYENGRLKNKHNVYDDINAVAEDLINNKLTSQKRLTVMGGSAGGLAACMSALLRPELYAGVLCAHPILDLTDTKNVDTNMVNNQYGNYENADFRAYLKKYSPIYNIEDKEYPPFMLFAASNDTRVGSVDSRRFVKKMQDSDKNIFYVESDKAGHTMGRNKEFLYNWTIVHTFLEYCAKHKQ
jgi:prolyl oligopeptidase